MDKKNNTDAVINSLFGSKVYQAQIKNYEKINKKIIPFIEKFVKEQPGRFATTTDIRGKETYTSFDGEGAMDNFHTNKKYKLLFDELNKHVKAFITALGYDLTKFDIHIVKAWSTYTAKEQHIALHRHTASHFSTVYYVRADEMGNLKIEEEQGAKLGLFIPPTDQYFSKWNEFNFASYNLMAKTGNFVMFPSTLMHMTENNTKDIPRISISSDVLLTMKQGVSAEHCIPHPEGWLTI